MVESGEIGSRLAKKPPDMAAWHGYDFIKSYWHSTSTAPLLSPTEETTRLQALEIIELYQTSILKSTMSLATD